MKIQTLYRGVAATDVRSSPTLRNVQEKNILSVLTKAICNISSYWTRKSIFHQSKEFLWNVSKRYFSAPEKFIYAHEKYNKSERYAKSTDL